MKSGRIFSWHDDFWFEYSFLKPKGLDLAVEQAIRKVWKSERRYSVLDVGCGSGRFLRWLDQLGHHAVGIDPSAELVRKASGRVSSRVVVERAFAESLPFEDSSFDYVFFVFSLEFVHNPVQALSEGLRVARRGVFIASLQKCSPLVFGECFRSGRWWVWDESTEVTHPGGLGKTIGRVLENKKGLSPVALEMEYLWPGNVWIGGLKIVGKILAPVVLASLTKAIPVDFRLPVLKRLEDLRPLTTPFPNGVPVIRWNTFMRNKRGVIRKEYGNERMFTV
ncbi:class I SAM-dependent methyltransferase [Thermodesulforhabdus norvegica]|uniref:Methyltransferase domain-containing protein n=1 Tax=Thermodesulforhabdus norvegica TaxID=39841 RepID=A0A1I4UC32_9BACT|nr:class I SAM-dependent methyltransferase [Thermodesulforhabdus norvegica]SFM86475.1 Methyltransferase domain-containing protein [Thermodesulforhabdus norvegica]